ncbi:MAG: PHP domain-containing protein [Halarsenatibacteraceae bacterium]
MLFDTHIHENLFSGDSHLSPEQVLEEAVAAGLDGICITDHESKGFRTYIDKYEAIYGLKIIVGAEVLTRQGDILVFGFDDLPDRVIPADELLVEVERAGGVAIAAHPFRNNYRGIGDNIDHLAGLLHGVEGLNGSTSDSNNYRARESASYNKLPLLGGSDAHRPGRIGKYITEVETEVKSETDFIKAVRLGKVRPLYQRQGRYLPIKPLKEAEAV